MSSTKIINVSRDDRLEELLAIVKNTDASEVVFVLPKKTRAFKSEGHFVVLADEAKDLSKSISFLCSNPEVNALAKKYNFDVLSTKTEPRRSVIVPAETRLRAGPSPGVVAKNDGVNEEEEGEEKEKHEAPYGTEMDESGDPVYDEEEDIGEKITASNPPADFEIISASAKTRGMSDIVKPSAGKNIKVAQKDQRPVRIETHTDSREGPVRSPRGTRAQPGLGSRVSTETDIQSVWGHEPADNIWADISKSRPPAGGSKQPFFRKMGLNFNFKNFPKKGIGVLSAASILVLAFIIYITVGSAKIEIKPRSQALGTQLKVTMSPNFSSVDNSFNRIPGQLFTISKSASNEFNATAEKDAVQKSRGTITIYNEYSTSPQPLVATTRFEYLQGDKESGLAFRTLQTITVPGMKVENGVVTPGKVNVEIIADKAGQAYNIAAGDFGIMAWRERGDTARYENIYGRSSDSMHGGILGKAKVVSEFDYNNAKDNLTAKVQNDINEALKAQSAGLELLTSVEPKIDSVESTAEIDDAANTFTMTVNGSIMTMGYKKEDLMALIASHVEKINDLMIVPDKLELLYKDVAVNQTDKILGVVITIGGQGYSKINREDIAANLMGKNELQIKDYLSSIKDIDSAKVILSPFWVKKIPKNKHKINISLTF